MAIYKVMDSNELNEVFKFRYDVYAEAMGKRYDYYDLGKKQIYEDLDNNARIYVMRDPSRNLIGTARVNYNSEYLLDKELVGLGIDKTIFESKSYCMVSKLIISPNYWKSGKSVIFVKQIYKEILEDNIDFVIIYCFDKTLSFFEKFGFIKIHVKDQYRFYKKINVLILDVKNKKWLKKIKSPLYKIHELINAY
ncbi:MAG: hypothetical protein JSS53_07185 [Proteobacteria bacterium]|nr:hypothetical protein [Pseudomonadota bacterium]